MSASLYCSTVQRPRELPDPANTIAWGDAQNAVRFFAQQIPALVAHTVTTGGGNWQRDGRVYQYTSMRSLCAMVHPGSDHVDTGSEGFRPLSRIWATAGQYMNDRREFDHGREVVLAACSRAS